MDKPPRARRQRNSGGIIADTNTQPITYVVGKVRRLDGVWWVEKRVSRLTSSVWQGNEDGNIQRHRLGRTKVCSSTSQSMSGTSSTDNDDGKEPLLWPHGSFLSHARDGAVYTSTRFLYALLYTTSPYYYYYHHHHHYHHRGRRWLVELFYQRAMAMAMNMHILDIDIDPSIYLSHTCIMQSYMLDS